MSDQLNVNTEEMRGVARERREGAEEVRDMTAKQRYANWIGEVRAGLGPVANAFTTAVDSFFDDFETVGGTIAEDYVAAAEHLEFAADEYEHADAEGAANIGPVFADHDAAGSYSPTRAEGGMNLAPLGFGAAQPSSAQPSSRGAGRARRRKADIVRPADESAEDDLLRARLLLAAILAATATNVRFTASLEWAVAVLRGPRGATVALTSSAERGWIPPDLFLPDDVTLPWFDAESQSWEDISDPVSVLLQFAELRALRTGVQLTAIVTSAHIAPHLRARLTGVATAESVSAAVAGSLALNAPGPGLVDRLGMLGVPAEADVHELLSHVLVAEPESAVVQVDSANQPSRVEIPTPTASLVLAAPAEASSIEPVVTTEPAESSRAAAIHARCAALVAQSDAPRERHHNELAFLLARTPTPWRDIAYAVLRRSGDG